MSIRYNKPHIRLHAYAVNMWQAEAWKPAGWAGLSVRLQRMTCHIFRTSAEAIDDAIHWIAQRTGEAP